MVQLSPLLEYGQSGILFSYFRCLICLDLHICIVNQISAPTTRMVMTWSHNSASV